MKNKFTKVIRNGRTVRILRKNARCLPMRLEHIDFPCREVPLWIEQYAFLQRIKESGWNPARFLHDVDGDALPPASWFKADRAFIPKPILP
jgi:hypothetical protein